MATVAEVTDPLLHTFTTVLRAGPGVCTLCHGAPNEGFAVCYSCSQTRAQVSHPLARVIPISLYRHNSQLHTCLSQYKNNTVSTVRQAFQLQVAALFGRFISHHRECIIGTGANWDLLVAVPSSSGRIGEHPLETALNLLAWDEQFRQVLRRSAGAMDHNQADDAGYEVVGDVDGLRVLLVDDTFTTGARLQSAASALQAAGASIVAAVVIGRIVNPDYNETARSMWDRAVALPFVFERCCQALCPGWG